MNLDPFEKNLFVFCGRSQRLIKIIYWVILLSIHKYLVPPAPWSEYSHQQVLLPPHSLNALLLFHPTR
ncbi:MAG TPA: hypothetical protein PLX69_24600 [Leptospiraceae bacterium]|nr:hypothetical protein [Leptospiraceae bacterium]HRG77764.1 hypothetical protein [Leptospiraceae bacterium]